MQVFRVAAGLSLAGLSAKVRIHLRMLADL
jgi:hypothetical protein